METIIVFGAFLVLGTLEAIAGLYSNGKLNRKDWLINVMGLSHLALIVKPAIVVGIVMLLSVHWPSGANMLDNLPWLAGFILVLLPADLMHYFYHRLGHEWRPLYHIHRTHHVTSHMHIGAAFRENIFWYVLMPDLYYGAAMLYLGLEQQYVTVLTLTGVMNVVNHLGVRWDLKLNLYEHVFTRKIMYVAERILNLPDAHHAHHGLGCYQHLSGNYGQLLSIWDVIFGTARFPHHAQERFGLNRGAEEKLCVQLYFPVCKPTASNSPWRSRRSF